MFWFFLQPPAKPPRKSITSLSPSGKTQHHIRQSSVTYDSTSQNPMMYDPSDIVMPRTPPSGFANSADTNMVSHQQPMSNGKEASPFSALYDEVASGKVVNTSGPLLGPKVIGHRRRLTGEGGPRPDKPVPPAKPKTLDLRTKRQTVQIPLSPAHQQQPPTPEFPPPSPSTAALGIHEKIRPLSQVGSDLLRLPRKILANFRWHVLSYKSSNMCSGVAALYSLLDNHATLLDMMCEIMFLVVLFVIH